MKKYYHVDKLGLLTEGQEIYITNSTYSKFGMDCISELKKNRVYDNFDQNPSMVDFISPALRREYYLEYFRKNSPHLKDNLLTSRLNCLFAVKEIDDAKQLIVELGLPRDSIIREVFNSNSPLILDMKWLDYDFPVGAQAPMTHYHNYWLGKKVVNENMKEKRSLMEVLLTGKIIIGKSVV